MERVLPHCYIAVTKLLSLRSHHRKKMEAPRSTGVRTVGGAFSGPNKEKLGGSLERNSRKNETGKKFLKQRDSDVTS
jgi:hypothetical protein